MSSRRSIVPIRVPPFERYRPIVDDWRAFQEVLASPLPICIWTNTLRTTPATLSGLMDAEGIPLEPLSWYPGAFRLPDRLARPGRHWAFLGGLCHVQEEVSLLPVLLLAPRPGERVLDLCAAPGNKTAQIAVAMQNRGTLVANDRDFHRLRALHHTIERLGILNTSTTRYDGANYPRGADGFDKVLVDVPCSCEGTSRKSPELRVDPSGGLSRRLSGAQKALLRKAIQLCRPGGRIVYASCTYAPEENEAVIDAVLREVHPGTVRLLPARVEGFRSSPGLKRWDTTSFDPSLELAMRVWPHQNDTGGFFVALLEKTRSGDSGSQETLEPGREAHAPGPPPPSLETLLAGLEQRFGIPRATFYGYDLFQRNPRELRIVSKGHHPPAQPVPESIGIVFMRTRAQVPKLTTAAAMIFGHGVTRNAIEMGPLQIDAFLRRKEVPLREDQARAVTGPGYVVVRHRSFTFGLGLYRPHREEGQARIESLFPRAWSPQEAGRTEEP